jgi:hypothetical protein
MTKESWSPLRAPNPSSDKARRDHVEGSGRALQGLRVAALARLWQ